MRQRRIMSFSSKTKDEHNDKLDYAKLSLLPFEDFQVQSAIIQILTKKCGRQFEDFQFINGCLMETEFYSQLIRDYGVELGFDIIQKMQYEQIDCHQEIYSLQNSTDLYLILNGNISKVNTSSSIDKCEISVQPEIKQYKRGECIGQELLQQNNKMINYTYVTKSRCDLAKIDCHYLMKKMESLQPKIQMQKEKKEIYQYQRIIEILKNNSLFDQVGHFDLFDISNNSQILNKTQGEYIYQKNIKNKYFYLVLDGEIQIIQGTSEQIQQQKEQSGGIQLIQQDHTSSSSFQNKKNAQHILCSRNGSRSPHQILSQQSDLVLSTIGKDQLFGIYEFLLLNQNNKNILSLYSTKVISQSATLLQIKGKVIKKLKIINSPSFVRIKRLIQEQKRMYEERERVSGAVKLNFLMQVTDDIMIPENMRQSFQLNQDVPKDSKIISGQSENLNNQNNNNVASANNQFYQLYSQTPYGSKQSSFKLRNNNLDRLNISRLSIDSVKNSVNTIQKGTEEVRTSLSSCTPNLLFSNNIYSSHKNIQLTSLDSKINSSNNNNNQKNQFDIFNNPNDPICQSLSLQLNEKMAKNKKIYFIQAMRELEKSSRTNPYTHYNQSQYTNNHNLQQNQSIDKLRKSPNARERNILQKYIQIKKKTEFKTDIDRNEEKLLRIQEREKQKQKQSQQLQLQLQEQQNNDIQNKLTTNDSLNSKKQLRILSDSVYNNRYSQYKSNQSRIDYYDHPINLTSSFDTQQQQQSLQNQTNQSLISGKQTPNIHESSFQVISEEDLHNTNNSFISNKQSERKSYSLQSKKIISKYHYHYNNGESSNPCIDDEDDNNNSSISNNQKLMKINKKENELFQIQPLQQINQNNKINQNNSLQNINLEKSQIENKQQYTFLRRQSENQNNIIAFQQSYNKIQNNKQEQQFMYPSIQKTQQQQQQCIDLEQENNNFDENKFNELNKYLKLHKNKNIQKRNLSAQRSISVKHSLPKPPVNKRILMII